MTRLPTGKCHATSAVPPPSGCPDTPCCVSSALFQYETPSYKNACTVGRRPPQLLRWLQPCYTGRKSRPRSPSRPLLDVQNEVGALEHPFPSMLKCFCLAQRQLGWPMP